MKTLKVFYNENQQVSDNSSFSPSAGKPKLVLESWQALRPDLIEVIESKPCSRAMIALAHAPEYVRDLLDCKIPNGFGNTLKSVAKSLPYTTGSFTEAALDAAKNNTINASLTSGFHHACYSNGGGFCSLNGLMIAAQMLRLHGHARKVGILDLDQHVANGCHDIKKKLGLDYVEIWDLGSNQGLYTDEDEQKFQPSSNEGDRILKLLPKVFAEKFKDCDVLLVQLGADSCKDDPLGHTFTKAQMLQRDRLVFSLMKKYNLPGVFCLAGGYQNPVRKVLDLHDLTLKAWEEVYA